jgi:hypothetical protein
MKYTSQRNRLAAIEAQIGRPGQVLRIIGGLPEGYRLPDPSPAESTESAPTDRPPDPSRDRG